MTYLHLMMACEDEAERTTLRAQLWQEEREQPKTGIVAVGGGGPPAWMKRAGK